MHELALSLYRSPFLNTAMYDGELYCRFCYCYCYCYSMNHVFLCLSDTAIVCYCCKFTCHHEQQRSYPLSNLFLQLMKCMVSVYNSSVHIDQATEHMKDVLSVHCSTL
jgi:hypothetical protein